MAEMNGATGVTQDEYVWDAEAITESGNVIGELATELQELCDQLKRIPELLGEAWKSSQASGAYNERLGGDVTSCDNCVANLEEFAKALLNVADTYSGAEKAIQGEYAKLESSVSKITSING